MNKLSKLSFLAAGAAVYLCAAPISDLDQMFAKKAAQGGMAEVQLGQLAAGKASSPKVRDFGQKMAVDHAKANAELKAIAERDRIILPGTLSPKDKALYNRLSSLSGAEFDKTYMSAMVEDHKTDIGQFESEAANGQETGLKSFAANTLPTLKEHLSLAQDAAGSVGATAAKN